MSMVPDVLGTGNPMGGGLPGLPGGTQSFPDLHKKYSGFVHPRVYVLLGGKPFNTEKNGLVIGDVRVELTCNYEASIATFRVLGAFNRGGEFDFDIVKKDVTMGNAVEIRLGYLSKLETVFVGFICGVDFGFQQQELPYIEVTAMDVKGLMMGGTYANQLKATTYSGAVEEILNRTGQSTLETTGGVTKIKVTKTPDARGGAPVRESPAPGTPSLQVPSVSPPPMGKKSSPLSIEMVSESDYEFVVRAAKRYNFEFFVDRGTVLFRPAKDDSRIYLKLKDDGLMTFNIGYSITSLVGEIQARAMDAGTGKAITAKKKFKNNIANKSKVKKLVGKGSKIFVDPSITSRKEAEARVAALMEKMKYRLGSLEANCVGIPELLPGRFIEIDGMGYPVDNVFYITKTVHELSEDSGYHVQIEGCTSSLKKGNSGLK